MYPATPRGNEQGDSDLRYVVWDPRIGTNVCENLSLVRIGSETRLAGGPRSWVVHQFTWGQVLFFTTSFEKVLTSQGFVVQSIQFYLHSMQMAELGVMDGREVSCASQVFDLVECGSGGWVGRRLRRLQFLAS